MEQRTNRRTTAFVDWTGNVAATFRLATGVRVMWKLETPPPTVQRVMLDGGARPPCDSLRYFWPEVSGILGSMTDSGQELTVNITNHERSKKPGVLPNLWTPSR